MLKVKRNMRVAGTNAVGGSILTLQTLN